MIVLPNLITIGNRGQIIALLADHRIPAVTICRFSHAKAGCCPMALTILLNTAKRRLYRSHPQRRQARDLPVQQASKFEFIINLNTAKALSLTVPPAILTLADEPID